MLDKLYLIIEYSKSIGVEETDVMFFDVSERRVSSRNDQIENIGEISNGSYFIRMLKNGRLISLSFNLFDDYKKIISSAFSIESYMVYDKYVSFFHGINEYNVDVLGKGEFIDFCDLISDANKISKYSAHGTNIVNLEACTVSSKKTEKYILCTNGFRSRVINFANSYYVNLIAKDSHTGNLEQDYNFLISNNRNASLKFFVDECVNRCNRKLNSKKLKSGKYHIIIERRAAIEFIQHFLNALNGDVVSKQGSFLCNLLGKKVFSNDINIYDDPLYKDGLFYNNYDDEGRAISKLDIIDHGILKNYLLDTYHAKKMNLKSNRGFNRSGIINANYTNLFVNSDHVENFEEICSKHENVILVTDFIGMGVNLVNGNYSRGISGNMVINGKISHAVSEITLSGNLLDMYKNMILLDDIRYENGISISSVYVGELMVSGE